MTIEQVSIEGEGAALNVFEVRPDTSAALPAVILLPAIAGINDYVKGRAEDLAGEGYHVALLDYYSREGAAPDCSTPEAIGKAVANLPDPRVASDIRSVFVALQADGRVQGQHIGSLGFCIGGMFSYFAGCDLPELGASVDYYGLIKYGATSENKPVSPIERANELQAPLLAHFGTFDRLISEADIADFEGALQENQKPYEAFLYRGAPHAFDENFRPPVFRPCASADAWGRSIAFLSNYLK